MYLRHLTSSQTYHHQSRKSAKNVLMTIGVLLRMKSMMKDSNHILEFIILAVYSEVGGDEELPLGPEFQDHLRCFVDNSKKDPVERYRMSEKLIRQLEYVNEC